MPTVFSAKAALCKHGITATPRTSVQALSASTCTCLCIAPACTLNSLSDCAGRLLGQLFGQSPAWESPTLEDTGTSGNDTNHRNSSLTAAASESEPTDTEPEEERGGFETQQREATLASSAVKQESTQRPAAPAEEARGVAGDEKQNNEDVTSGQPQPLTQHKAVTAQGSTAQLDAREGEDEIAAEASVTGSVDDRLNDADQAQQQQEHAGVVGRTAATACCPVI